MNQVRLGRSNLQVSRIAFGAWELGGDWGATAESAAIATIRQAADHGINFFDTAQGYGFGASEELIARALEGRPPRGRGGRWKGRLAKMENSDHSPQFPLEWGLKDIDLTADATGPQAIPVALAIADRWRLLVGQGNGRLDVSAARLGLTSDAPVSPKP